MSIISKFRDGELYFHHSYDEHPDPEEFIMHAHDAYEILYVVSGSGSFGVEGTHYKLFPNSMFITRPSETHHIVIDSTHPYERMAIHFSRDTVISLDESGDLLRAFNIRKSGRNNYLTPDSIDGAFCKMCFDRMASSADYGRECVISYLLPMLCEIRKCFDGAQKTIEHKITEPSELVDYVNRNLFNDLSLDKVSEHFFISKSQVNRTFRKATGSTVWEYVLIKRLLSARSAIKEGIPINEAFRASGFKDYSTFWRAYKNHFGCSPKDDT